MEKTPWRKNLDKRYISGEDLLLGLEMGKGLRPEMVVTLAKHEDAPAFDQKLQKEVDKTAVWLKEYPSGKMLYKPCLLNVENGAFLSKEIGNNSLYLEDFDTTKPFIIYAKPDKRHGHVARFKKYYPSSTVSDENALKILSSSVDKNDLLSKWTGLSSEEKTIPSILALKDKLKETLK